MVSVPQAPVPLSRRALGIAPVVLVSFVLQGCGGGGGGPPAVPPETDRAVERPSLPPGFPVNAYLWPGSVRPGAPVMEFGGSVHVGADVAPPAGALAAGGERNGVALSAGTVRDGTSAADVVRYLRIAASHNLAGGRFAGLATYPETPPPPTVRLVSSEAARGWGTRFGRLTQEAVRILNAALPFGRQLRINPHPAPRDYDRATSGRGQGEIRVRFVPKTHPAYPSDANPSALGTSRVSFDVRDEAAATLEVSAGGAFDSEVLIDPDAVASHADPEVIHVLVHELLHAVGFASHTDPAEFDSTLSEAGFYPGAQPRGLIHPIDRDGLLAAYSRIPPGTLPEEISVDNLGPWTETSYHLRGGFDTGAGEVSFGVAFRNGLAQPWAFGPKPAGAFDHNPALPGSATWNGALLGITPAGMGVAGDASLTLDMESLSGELAFTGMRYDGGGAWGDSDLHYAVRALGPGNTFVRADAEFVKDGEGFDWTGRDLGTVTGAFLGPGHEAMGGVLERHDLSAAFGGRR